MCEWHVTPDYIVNNWTDELFDLMVHKLKERKKREVDALSGTPPKPVESEEMFLAKASNLVKVVKHGD